MRGAFRSRLIIWPLLFSICGCGLGKGSADEMLSGRVKQALYDHGEANLLRVDVSVEEGIIYLSGETDDAQQKRSADHIARRISGGAKVVNKVLVEP